MRPVIVKLVRDDGQEFLLDGSTWRILSLTGLDAAKFTVYSTENGAGDGSTVTGKRVSARDITVDARLRNAAINALMRRAAISFFRPSNSYRLYVTYQGITRWIPAELSAFSCPSGNVYRGLDLSFMLLCPDPYFRSVDAFGKDIAAIQGRFGFPFLSHPAVGFLTGLYNYAREVLVENDGDVETFCTAVLTASDSVVNPKLICGDAYVRILDTMTASDVVTIDLANSRVQKNGVGILNLVDRTSSFTGMGFSVGSNTISFSADTGENALHVTIYFNKLYLGV